jgi:hypothetical protein
MKGRVIFLLEEPSMKALLDPLLPRLVPGWREGEHFQCVPHEGKSDLDRSIPRKLAAWREPGVRFIVVRDNDGGDCLALKARLIELCRSAGRPDSLVRLVCQELESWYLGDLQALSAAFGDPRLATPVLRKRHVDPDSSRKPSVELRRLAPTFQKIGTARVMAAQLDEARNTSRSFRVFVSGVRRLASEHRAAPARRSGWRRRGSPLPPHLAPALSVNPTSAATAAGDSQPDEMPVAACTR